MTSENLPGFSCIHPPSPDHFHIVRLRRITRLDFDHKCSGRAKKRTGLLARPLNRSVSFAYFFFFLATFFFATFFFGWAFPASAPAMIIHHLPLNVMNFSSIILSLHITNLAGPEKQIVPRIIDCKSRSTDRRPGSIRIRSRNRRRFGKNQING